MKFLLTTISAVALVATASAFAADDNGMHPDSTKKPNPSVSSKNTNSDGSSVSSGANGTSTGASGNSSREMPGASDSKNPDSSLSTNGNTTKQ